jgi:hypothetical protein
MDKPEKIMKLLSLLFCLFLISCGGDGDGHHPSPLPPVCEFTYSEWSECKVDNTQIRTVISQQPEVCKGEPTLTQSCIYIPKPVNCCPNPAHSLLCGQCTEKNPCIVDGIYSSKPGDIRVECSTLYQGIAQWMIRIDWGTVVIRVDRPDLSCCPIEQTGITYEECNESKMCNANYAGQPTEWYLYSDQYNNWWVNNHRIKIPN